MQAEKLERLRKVLEIFEHELTLDRVSLKRATKRALAQYPRSIVNEVIDFLILEGRVPADTARADIYLHEMNAA